MHHAATQRPTMEKVYVARKNKMKTVLFHRKDIFNAIHHQPKQKT